MLEERNTSANGMWMGRGHKLSEHGDSHGLLISGSHPQILLDLLRYDVCHCLANVHKIMDSTK